MGDFLTSLAPVKAPADWTTMRAAVRGLSAEYAIRQAQPATTLRELLDILGLDPADDHKPQVVSLQQGRLTNSTAVRQSRGRKR